MRLHVEGQKFHGHLGTWHVVDSGGAILCETEYYLHDSREVEEILDELEEEEDLP